MNISDFVQTHAKIIDAKLDAFINEKKHEVEHINSWSHKLADQVAAFAKKGKRIRGNLVVLGSMFAKNETTVAGDIYTIAAAMELVHTALLIHDDAMDRDGMRRGEKSFWGIYKDLASDKPREEAELFASNMSTCIGDICYFWTYDLLNTLTLDPHIKTHIIGLFVRELVGVGFGQIDDVGSPFVKDALTLEAIHTIHLHKTARYTFSLPLMLGAIAANLDSSEVKKLESVGEYMGLGYQLKDDEIGMFGEDHVIGKTVGKDICENKNTYYKYYLYQRASEEEKEKLDLLFGKATIAKSELTYVQQLVTKYEIHTLLTAKMNELKDQAHERISDLKGKKERKDLLYELNSSIYSRSS